MAALTTLGVLKLDGLYCPFQLKTFYNIWSTDGMQSQLPLLHHQVPRASMGFASHAGLLCKQWKSGSNSGNTPSGFNMHLRGVELGFNGTSLFPLASKERSFPETCYTSYGLRGREMSQWTAKTMFQLLRSH